jgi:hypothetical protein
MIVLKWILNKSDLYMWTLYLAQNRDWWLTILLTIINLLIPNTWEVSCLAKRPLISQEDLFSIELVMRDLFSKDSVTGIPVHVKKRSKC